MGGRQGRWVHIEIRGYLMIVVQGKIISRISVAY